MTDANTTSNLFELTGKVAVVTGSSRGIGKAIATRMAQAGAKVVISSRKKDACQETADAINALCGETRAIVIPANISDKQSLQNLVETTLEQLGRIDILVCNAASNPHYGSMNVISDEQFTKILTNNIIANHWLISMVAPQMKERRNGSVILISSIGGLKGSDKIGAYNISKAADMQLARNMAVELGPDNIRVNTIAPGLIKTDFARALWENPKTAAQFESQTALHRIGEADEIAGAAIYLAADAGSYMTGQTLVIDGGVTITGG